MIDEEAQTIRVKLKPVFEHLRQLKLQDKGCFTAEIKKLDGILQSRSDRVKQALNNEHSDVNEMKDYGTRKKLLNTKIEPNLNGSIKNIVDRGGGLAALALNVSTVDCFTIFNYLQSSLRTLLACCNLTYRTKFN